MEPVDLPTLIDAAARRLTEARSVAEILAVRAEVGSVLAAADVAERHARRTKAINTLLQTARGAKVDALTIEAQALTRLADEYDAARSAGEMAGAGRPANADDSADSEKVPNGDHFQPMRLSEFGLTKQDIHRARQLRDAEAREPGIVARALQARMRSGDNLSRRALRDAIAPEKSARVGTQRSAAASDPDDANLYETPWVATEVLLDWLRPRLKGSPLSVLEPCCGPGAIAQVLEVHGARLHLADKHDYSVDDDGVVNDLWERHTPRLTDFLTDDAPLDGPVTAIITNPPYRDADTVVHRAKALAANGHARFVCLLLNGNFLFGCGEDRCESLDQWQPAKVIALSRRLPMMHRAGWDGPKASSSMNTAWFIWDTEQRGRSANTNRLLRRDWAKVLALTEAQITAVNKGAGRDEILGRA